MNYKVGDTVRVKDKAPWFWSHLKRSFIGKCLVISEVSIEGKLSFYRLRGASDLWFSSSVLENDTPKIIKEW